MPKTYLTLDPENELYHQILDAMDEYHKPLREAGLTMTVIMCSGPRDQNGDVCGPAITVNGYQAMASIKITNLEQRATGLGDVILKIDADRIDELSEAQQRALWDHELTHVELVLDKNGAVKRDDCKRPVLKARKHDIQIGGFSEVIKKHKQHALEAMQVQEAWVKFVQPELAWG